MGAIKWYLGMRIRQDQDQYVKNITTRFEKSFKHPFKLKDSPLPASFVPTKKDSPSTEAEVKEVKIRFGNLNYRSVIGALLYVSYCTRPDISFAVNKLAKYANNPGATHFWALLHLIGFLKGNSNKGLKFYRVITNSKLNKILQENNIEIGEDTNITFTDSLWNDCVDAGRSTGAYVIMSQADPAATFECYYMIFEIWAQKNTTLMNQPVSHQGSYWIMKLQLQCRSVIML